MNIAFWLYVIIAIFNLGGTAANHKKRKRPDRYNAYVTGFATIVGIAWLYAIALGGFP